MLFTKSPNTVILYGILRRLKRGEDVTYEALSRAIGVDVTTDAARGWLMSARRAVQRSEKIVFDAKPRVGLHAMTDEELALFIERKSKQSGRRDARIVRMGACVNPKNVTPATLTALEAALYVQSVASALKGPRGVDAARKALAANAPPSLGDTLAFASAST